MEGHGAEIGPERTVHIAHDVALQAADDFLFRPALTHSSRHIGACAWTVSESHDDRHVQGPVRLPVAAVIQSVSGRAARGSRYRSRGAEVCKRCLGVEAADVLAGGY